MSISAGSDILASDFVSNPSGASDSGKVVKLNDDGHIDRGFLLRSAQTRLTLSGNYAVAGFPIPWDTEDYDDGADALHNNTAAYDTYATAQDSNVSGLSATDWRAQKIVTGANDRLLKRIKVHVQTSGGVNIDIRIRSTLTGSDLYTAAIWNNGTQWLTFDNIGLLVDPNTTYYVIVHRESGSYNLTLGTDSTASYASGGFYTSSNSGSSWSGEDTSKDMAMEVQIDNRPIITVQEAGYYLVTAVLPPTGTGTITATMYQDSTVVAVGVTPATDADIASLTLTTILKCAADDIIYVKVSCDGTPSIAASGASFCAYRLA